MKSILTIILFSIILSACQPNKDAVTTTTNQASDSSSQAAVIADTTIEVLVLVEGQPIDQSPFSLSLEEGEDLLSAMKRQLTIEEKDGFVQSINGHQQDAASSKYWLFDVNGKPSEVGANQVYPKAKDKIEWRLDVLN